MLKLANTASEKEIKIENVLSCLRTSSVFEVTRLLDQQMLVTILKSAKTAAQSG